jgi:hypothetical protein
LEKKNREEGIGSLHPCSVIIHIHISIFFHDCISFFQKNELHINISC